MTFGTIFWSSEPDKIWAVIDEIMSQGILFVSRGCDVDAKFRLMTHVKVFAHPSLNAVIPEDVLGKLNSSNLVYHAQWLPMPPEILLRHSVRSSHTYTLHVFC
jgi:hypothetical protein